MNVELTMEPETAPAAREPAEEDRRKSADRQSAVVEAAYILEALRK